MNGLPIICTQEEWISSQLHQYIILTKYHHLIWNGKSYFLFILKQGQLLG